MSSTGQIVGGIVGAVIGFYAAGPVGAFQGFALGAGIGGYLDPPKGPTVEGPRLTDKSAQTSTYGATIPRIYGTCMVAGNVFWLEKDQLKETVKKESSGGKGGGSTTEVRSYVYSATFAVGLCKGPIAGVRRIWVGPDLLYDAASDDLDTIIASNQNAEGFTLYLGTEDQLPDSRMQADKGTANVPAYRGLAYLLVKDFELTKYGNSLAQAQVKVEIVQSQQNELVLVDDFTFEDSNIHKLGGVSSSGITSLMAIVSGKLIVIRRSSGSTSSYEKYDYSEADFFDPINTSTPENYAYTFSTPSIPSYISIISDVAFYSDTLLLTITYGSRINDQMIGRVGGGIVFSSDNAFDDAAFAGYGIIKKLIVFPESSIPSTGSLAICGVMDGKFAIVMQDGSTFRIYTVEINANTLSFVFVGSTAGSGVYGFNKNGFWKMLGNSIIEQYSPSLELKFSILTNAYIRDNIYAFNNDIISCLKQNSSAEGEHRNYAIKRVENLVSLSSIVESETLLSKILSPADVVVSDLSDSVFGYRVASAGSIRNGIEPLRGAWPFDVIQDGYKIRYRRRGTASVATIEIGELGLEQQIQESREMDSQLPRKVIIKHIDYSRDYDPNEQSDQRENVDTVNTLSMDLPVVLSPTEAKRVAQKLLYLYWLERSDFSFVLPPTYQYLQPSDVVTIDAGYASYEIRISTIKYTQEGKLECIGKPNSVSVYTSIADTDGGLNPPVTIPLAGPSQEVLIDAPIIDESMQNAPGFSAFMSGITSGWPGGSLFVTNDNGQTWQALQSFVGKGTFGLVSGSLSANAGTQIQKGGSIIVSLLSGSLESITEDQMKNGRNYAAYGSDGRWEIIRFQNATLDANGNYTLDTFIRGDRGTEWATGLHQSGDTFVLMDDPDGAWISQASSSIGVDRGYRSVTAGFNIDSDATANFTYRGVNLETYSPTHGKGERDVSSNLTISWTRRTRVGGEWRSLVDASIGETLESYEVDVMNGSTIVRTLTSSTQSVIYSAANQTTDFGSPQASVTVRIYQLSSVVGRGQPLEVTV
jgi:hypothetical protein